MMKKVFLVMLAVILTAVSAIAAAEHHFDVVTGEDGAVYDLFVITKMNYGEDHKVVSVTGHFERVVTNEEGEDSPESLPDGETTFTLAEDYQALMVEEPNDTEKPVTVTDLYQWYVDVYVGGEEELEGRELVFQCDFPEDEQIDATYDFGFLTTRIHLNELNEIDYMEYVYVPWA